MNPFQKAVKALATALAVILIIGSVAAAVRIVERIVGVNESDHDGALVIDQDNESFMRFYDGDTFTQLDIDVSNAEVVVTDGDELSVTFDKNRVKVKSSDGKLTVKTTGKNHKTATRIDLTVPDGLRFAKAELSIGAGSLTVDKLVCDDLSADIGAGRAVFALLNVSEQVSFDVGAGSLSVSDGSLSHLHLDAGAGGVDIAAALTGNADIDLAAGSFDLIVKGPSSDYTVKLDGGLFTDCRINGEKVGGGKYGSGKNVIDVDGGIGRIEISFEA